MTLETRAHKWLQTGSSIRVNLTLEPMRQVENGLIGSDVEIADQQDPAIAKIYAESTGPTDRRKFRGSATIPKGKRNICGW